MAPTPASTTARTVPLPAFVAIAAAGVLAGFAVFALTLASDYEDDRGAVAALMLVVGWSFVGTGLFAWWRRPGNRTGPLMAAAGFAWFASALSAADDDTLFTIGIALDALFLAAIVHVLLAFPTGRLQTAAERWLVALTYLNVTVLQLPSLLFEEDSRNQIVIEPDQSLSDLLDGIQFGVAVATMIAGGFVLARRWRAASPPQRRAVAPVVWTGAAVITVAGIAVALETAGARSDTFERLSQALLALVPFAFLAALLRTRLSQAAAVSELVARLGDAPDPPALRAALATALGDPSLSLAYWLPASERFVDADGRPLELPAGSWAEVELHGRRIAAIVHDPSLADEPQLVRTAGAAAALALDNQRLSAELRARIEELRESRARLVEVGDAERRRLERNLHDGAQARLVALSIKLQLARRRAEDDPAQAALLDELTADLRAGLEELRELARGIHPAVLTDRGLGAALAALASRAPVPVEITEPPPDGLPAQVETAIYFVVAEALTNVAKYARAGHATVTVRREPAAAVVEVVDDGAGGAEPARGSGLRGLADRLAALDGRLDVHSPRGGGTRLRAELPL